MLDGATTDDLSAYIGTISQNAQFYTAALVSNKETISQLPSQFMHSFPTSYTLQLIDGAFSMNLLWDRAIAAGRLFGVEHTGRWLHVGTPEAIGLAEAALGA